MLHWQAPYYLFLYCLLLSLFCWQQHVRHNRSNPIPWGFFVSLGLLCLVVGSPLHRLGRDSLMLARMLETVIAVYVLPPLALRALPMSVMAHYWQNSQFRRWSLPLRDLVWNSVLFNSLFFLLHLPWVYQGALRTQWLDQLLMFVFWLLGLWMWLPLNIRFDPMRLSTPRRMFYLVTLVLGQVPVFAFLSFQRQVLYTYYAQVVPIIDISTLADQQMSGWLLKLTSSLIFACAFVVIFLDWSRHQRAQDVEDNALAVENFSLVQKALKHNRKGQG